MKKHNILPALFIFLLGFVLCQPLFGQPFTPPSAFSNKTDGTIVFAEDWNNTIGGLYTYITYTLLPQLNVLASKGDMYIFNGTQLGRLPVGSNNQVLTADSTQSLGIKWASGAGLPLTTIGDLLGYTGSALARIPVGTNGQVLTANSSASTGVSWGSIGNLPAFPGMIIMYNQTYGGSIPAGWVICDGNNGTPNMIGMVPIGGQISGGSSSANPSGYGNTTYGNTYGSTLTSGTVSISGTTSGPNATASLAYQSGGNGYIAASSGHNHTFGGSGNFSVSNQPATLSLVFIMKQ